MKKLLALLSILLMFTCVQAANFAQPLDGLGDEVVLSDYSQGEVFEQPTSIEGLTFEPLGNEIYPSLPLLAVQTEGLVIRNTTTAKGIMSHNKGVNAQTKEKPLRTEYYYEVWGLSGRCKQSMRV